MRLNPPACSRPKAVEKLQLASNFDFCMKIIAPTWSLACRNRNANVDQRLSRSTHTRELGSQQHESERLHMPISHRNIICMSACRAPTECITPGLKARAEQRKNLSDFPII